MRWSSRRPRATATHRRECFCASDAGYIVFFTNYQSRKGQELAARPRAAAVFHWDALHRQVRIEGPILRSPAGESDEYFASRALESRIAAWASAQSEPLASREALQQRVREVAARFHPFQNLSAHYLLVGLRVP